MTKKLRFEVFKKHYFTCQYCGRKPPETVLEIDHIIPKSQGGLDEIENLVTSCFDCNRGKGKRMLTELMPEMQKDADLLKERKEQLKAFYKHQKEIEKLTNEAITILSDYWSELTENEYSLSATAKITLKNFLKTFTIQEIKEAMEISTKIDNIEQRFRYFCGILHNKRLEKNDPELHELIRYWKNKEKGSGYYKREGLEVLLKGREESGHYPHSLEDAKSAIDVVFAKSRSSYYGTLVDYLNDEKYINDEVSDFWERRDREKEKQEWNEMQSKNEVENPLLFQAINYYTSLINDYFMPKISSGELDTLIKKYGIGDTLKMIDYALIAEEPSEIALYNLANNKKGEIKKYEKWLDKGYKDYLSLCKEARVICEKDDVGFLNRTLLILSINFTVDEAESVLLYVASKKGDLQPEHFSDLQALYAEYLEEQKSIDDFLERKSKVN